MFYSYHKVLKLRRLGRWQFVFRQQKLWRKNSSIDSSQLPCQPPLCYRLRYCWTCRHWFRNWPSCCFGWWQESVPQWHLALKRGDPSCRVAVCHTSNVPGGIKLFSFQQLYTIKLVLLVTFTIQFHLRRLYFTYLHTYTINDGVVAV